MGNWLKRLVKSSSIAFNASKTETTLTNVAPLLTTLLQNLWLPHLAKYGALDWDIPTQPVSGNTVNQQVNNRLIEYYAVKGQEGRPQNEQRKWRFNLVTRYGFSEGQLRGFSSRPLAVTVTRGFHRLARGDFAGFGVVRRKDPGQLGRRRCLPKRSHRISG